MSTHANEANPLRSVCAWCAVELRPGVEPTSHDICPACDVAMRRQAKHFERYGLTSDELARACGAGDDPDPATAKRMEETYFKRYGARLAKWAAGMAAVCQARNTTGFVVPGGPPLKLPNGGLYSASKRGKSEFDIHPPPRDEDIGRCVRISFDPPRTEEHIPVLDFARIEAHGHRWEQVCYSLVVAGVCVVGGVLVGCLIALWRAWQAAH